MPPFDPFEPLEPTPSSLAAWSRKIRKWLLAPLIYTAAILLLLEQYLWNASKRLLAYLPSIKVIIIIENWVRGLPPYAALAIFLAPTLLLLPVKLLALISITHGHPWMGALVVIVAKLGGTALLTRLYALTQSVLMTLPWFVRCHNTVITTKDAWIAHLRATRAWRQLQRISSRMTLLASRWWHAIRQNNAGAHHPLGHLIRLIKKYAARWRDRM